MLNSNKNWFKAVLLIVGYILHDNIAITPGRLSVLCWTESSGGVYDVRANGSPMYEAVQC